jgi:hypothetical protein
VCALRLLDRPVGPIARQETGVFQRPTGLLAIGSCARRHRGRLPASLSTDGGQVPRRTELSSLESHLGYWIRYVSNHVSHAFALKLGARCDCRRIGHPA